MTDEIRVPEHGVPMSPATFDDYFPSSAGRPPTTPVRIVTTESMGRAGAGLEAQAAKERIDALTKELADSKSATASLRDALVDFTRDVSWSLGHAEDGVLPRAGVIGVREALDKARAALDGNEAKS